MKFHFKWSSILITKMLVAIVIHLLGFNHSVFASDGKKILVLGAPGSGKTSLISSALLDKEFFEIAISQIQGISDFNPKKFSSLFDRSTLLLKPAIKCGSLFEVHESESIIEKKIPSTMSQFAESCDFSTKEFKSYRDEKTSTTWIDSPGLTADNVGEIESYVKDTYLSSSLDRSDDFDKIVIVIEMDGSDINLIDADGKFAAKDSLVMRQLELAKQALSSSIDFTQGKSPIVFVLTPSHGLLKNLVQRGLASLDIPIDDKADKMLKKYAYLSIARAGFDIDSTSIVGTLRSLVEIYQGYWTRDEHGRLNLGSDLVNLDAILSEIERTSRSEFKLQPSVEIKKHNEIKALGDRLEALNKKADFIQGLESTYKVDLAVYNAKLQSTNELLSRIENFEAAKSKSSVVVKQPTLKVDKNRHRFKFSSVSESKEASYTTDRYFFGENQDSVRGLYLSRGQKLRKMTSDTVSMPKKIVVADVNQHLHHTLFSTEFEFSSDSHVEDLRKVRIEYFASGHNHQEFDLSAYLLDTLSFHDRGKAEEIFYYGHEYAVPGEKNSGPSQHKVKLFAQDELEDKETENKLALLRAEVSGETASEKKLDSYNEIQKSYNTIREEYQSGIHELLEIENELLSLGLSGQNSMIERLVEKTESRKKNLSIFALKNNADLLNGYDLAQKNMRSMHKKVRDHADSLSANAFDSRPENQLFLSSEWSFYDMPSVDRSTWSPSLTKKVESINKAIDNGMLISFVDADGTLVYRTKDASLMASLYSTLLVPRYKTDVIASQTASKPEFARHNNFIDDESNEADGLQRLGQMSEKTKHLKIVVFGPRKSGKTTFLNTVNHFASTIDYGVNDLRGKDHNSNEKVPIRAWLDNGFEFDSWTDEYFGNETMPIGALRAQLPCFNTTGNDEQIKTCSRSGRQEGDSNTISLDEQFLKGDRGTTASGAVVDTAHTTKSIMIPQYRLGMLDTAGVRKPIGIYDEKEKYEESSYFFRAIKKHKEFDTFDGIIVVLNADEIVSRQSSYLTLVKKEFKIIEQIRKKNGFSQPLHIVYTNIVDSFNSVQRTARYEKNKGPVSPDLVLRFKLEEFIGENIQGSMKSIFQYHLEHDTLWGNKGELSDDRVFASYKLFAHEINRLLGNISENPWNWETTKPGDVGSDSKPRSCLDCVKELVERERLTLSTKTIPDVSYPEVTEISLNKGNESQLSLVGTQRLEGVDGFSCSLMSEKNEPGFMQILRIAEDDHGQVSFEGIGTVAMHYFSPWDPKKKTPDMVYRNHWRNSYLREAAASKKIEEVIERIESLKDHPLGDTSEGAVDLFVVRSIGNVGKMRGEYFCENIFTGFGRFDMMQACQVGNLVKGLADRREALNISADVDLDELAEASSRYACEHRSWEGRQELNDEDLKLGRDLELMIFVKRVVENGEGKISIEKIELKKNPNDLRSPSGFDRLDISRYLERKKW